jgi:hypothetical protein
MNQTTTTQHASKSAALSASGSADAYNCNDSNNKCPATHFGSHNSLMNSSKTHPYHHQQNFVTPTPRLIFHNGNTSFTPPMQPMHLETTHTKRTREISATEISSSSSTYFTTMGILLPSCVATVVEQQPPSLAKKARNQYYIPPRQLPRSFASQVGSLVVPKDCSSSSGGIIASTHHDSSANPHRIGFRRQLSSSKIEALLSSVDHDSMDLDPETTRPRSMSF